jgi:hypothetical protein
MSLFIESMSLSLGTPLSVVVDVAIKLAAMSGKALFLLPLISILPLRRLPPRIRKLSINMPVLGPRPNYAAEVGETLPGIKPASPEM